jgi:AcrR family transcriptional regulator
LRICTNYAPVTATVQQFTMVKETTKDKIISKAIDLYNAQGFSNITSRDIAKELEISHGNLEYHYKNKEAVLSAIYDRMKEEVSAYFSETNKSLHPFEQFNVLLRKLDHFQNKYKFFNLDVVEISRQFPKLRLKVETTAQMRKDQMIEFFGLFEKSGYFKPEPNKGFYLRLQHKIRVLITFWVSQETILKNFDTTQSISMSQSIWDLLLPNFTEKGKNEYNKLNSNPQFLKLEKILP